MTTEKSSNDIKVWDSFIRAFHWTLVAAFILSYLTEGDYGLHFYSGWYIGVLLILRIIWGLIGSKHARFSDFVKSPTDIMSYAKSLLSTNKETTDNDSIDNEQKFYLGHNPLGGLMIMVMLVSLSCSVISGVMLYKTEGNEIFDFIGSTVFEELDEDHYDDHNASYEESDSLLEHQNKKYEEHEEDEFWEEIHEFFTNFTLLLILIHIVGVIFSSRRENRNLVKAMITGKK